MSGTSTSSSPSQASVLRFQTNEVLLRPKIHLIGDLTPSNVVEWVLHRFGVEQESIPEMAYSMLNVQLEGALVGAGQLLDQVESTLTSLASGSS